MLSTPSRTQSRASLVTSAGAVGEHREAVAELMCAALVAETAGHGDLGAAGAQAGAGQFARLDRVADHHVDAQLGAGGAVGAGEAVVEQQPRVARGDQRVFLGRRVAEIGRACAVDEGDVGVALDQAGHQRHAAGLDHLRAGRLELAALAWRRRGCARPRSAHRPDRPRRRSRPIRGSFGTGCGPWRYLPDLRTQPSLLWPRGRFPR